MRTLPPNPRGVIVCSLVLKRIQSGRYYKKKEPRRSITGEDQEGTEVNSTLFNQHASRQFRRDQCYLFSRVEITAPTCGRRGTRDITAWLTSLVEERSGLYAALAF